MSVVLAQSSPTSNESLEIKIQKPIELDGRLNALLANIDCPPLPAGKPCLIHATLINPLDEVIQVVGGDADCGCTQAKLTPTEILPHGTATLEISIETPRTRTSATFSTGLYFDAITDQGPVRINLGLTCKLMGLLNFKSGFQSVQLHSDTDPSSFYIPLVTTLDDPDFKVEFDGNLVLEHTQVAPDSKRLTITVSPELIPESGTFGRLTLLDARSEQSAKIDLLIKRPTKFVISPRTIRLLQSDSDDVLRAQAFIRFAESMTVAQSPAYVEAYINNNRINVISTRLGERVLRLQISCSSEVFPQALPRSGDGSENDFTIDWRVLVAGERINESSPFLRVIEGQQ